MHYGVSGERIDGVELDMPEWMANQFTDGISVKKDGCHFWMNPSLLYRNKGECARAKARENIGYVNAKIENMEQELESLSKSRDEKTFELLQLEKRRSELVSSYGKEKWFLE